MDTHNPRGYKLSAWLDRETAIKLKIYAALRDMTLSDAAEELISRALRGIQINREDQRIQVEDKVASVPHR